MKREERIERLGDMRRESTTQAKHAVSKMELVGPLTRKSLAKHAAEMTTDATAITETLAELERYRALLVKCSDALATGYTNEELKVIEVQYRGCSMGWMAHWALYIREVLADEEAKPDE